MNLNTATVQYLPTIHVEEESWLWHYRYGYLNFKSLNQLNSKKMVCDMPLIHILKKKRWWWKQWRRM